MRVIFLMTILEGAGKTGKAAGKVENAPVKRGKPPVK
jgi:hypothetical protein